jgi:hypothetical protein
MSRLAPCVVLLLAVALAVVAQDTKKDDPPKKDAVKYRPGDMKRPRPQVIEPPTAGTEDAPGKPPSDAVVLFDGKDLSRWYRSGKKAGTPDAAPTWKVENGYAEIVPRSGGIRTKAKFQDSQVHIEWATPKEVKGNGQGRGNSGLYLGSARCRSSTRTGTTPTRTGRRRRCTRSSRRW